MNKEKLMNNLYDIITENIEDFDYENGVNIYLTDDNKICFYLNESEQVFALEVKELKENGTIKN